MLLRHLFVVAFAASSATLSQAAGFVHNENFVVYCKSVGNQQETQAFAQSVLEFADECRAEIARQWLGKELPPGIGRTVINIDFAEGTDSALTWAKDDPNRRYHSIYLTTPPGKVIDSTLKHELAHAVLATRWPHPARLPAWTEEGVASRYDDDSRIASRHQVVQWFTETGNWPRLERTLGQKTISAQRIEDYATAASLTDFLLSKADKATLFQFAIAGGTDGWNDALRKHYGMSNVDELQTQWQSWVALQQSSIRVATR